MNIFSKVKVITIAFICHILFGCSTDKQISITETSFKNLAPTPPMGWNSWNSFGIGVTEDQVKAVADYMAEHLKEYGWEYVVVDAGWYHPPTFTTPEWNDNPEPPQLLDEYGRLYPDPIKFPSSRDGKGLKPLADYIHSKGLKFGIHIMRGIPWNAVQRNSKILGTEYTAREIAEAKNRCDWTHVMYGINMTHPGGAAYYQSLVDLYSSWGVDYIKADDMSRPYRVDEVQGLSKILKNNPREIVLSLSPGAAPLMAAEDLREHAHLWRISGDFWDSWESLKKHFSLCEIWAPYIAENNWPDADMLPLGKLRKNGVGAWEASLFNATSEEVTDEYSRLTKPEQITLMNLWAIFKSPLMMGGYLPENDEFTLSLLTNKEMLKVNQESINNRVILQDSIQSIWMADLPNNNDKYLAIFNLSDQQQDLSIPFGTLGLSGKYSSLDIWSKEEKKWDNKIEVVLQPHNSVLYLLNNVD